MRGANAVGTPGIILEHSFHTNTRITKWLLVDKNLQVLAMDETECIDQHFVIAISTTTYDSVPFLVKVDIPDLIIRKGAGTNTARTAKYTGVGGFTIVEVRCGKGSTRWLGQIEIWCWLDCFGLCKSNITWPYILKKKILIPLMPKVK